MKHQVAILENLAKKFTPSKKCVDVEPAHPLFEDACNFVGLHYELSQLINCMEQMIEYNEIIMKECGEE